MKYSKFKAADILKAIKEGRTPTPGNPLATVYSIFESLFLLPTIV